MASRACLRWVAPPTATRRERRRCDQRSRRVARRAAAATADAADDAAAARDDGDDGGRHDFTTVFGRGRVASVLARALGISRCVLVGRYNSFPADDIGGPIYVATHASDLAAVLAKVPASRRRDVVLMQGGLLRRAWLEARGAADATQVALFLSARRDGDVVDGGGRTVACGPHAAHVVETLARVGVRCAEVDATEFGTAATEKLLWASIFWLMCATRGCAGGDAVTVGEIVNDVDASARAEALAVELMRVVVAAGELDGGADAAEDGTSTVAGSLPAPALPLLDAEALEYEGTGFGTDAEFEQGLIVIGLFRYCDDIPDAAPSAEMATREGAFRNGWFLAAAERYALETPLHERLLRDAGVDVDELRSRARAEHGL